MDHTGDTPEHRFVAERWESALGNANSSLDDLREVFPIHTWYLTESGTRAVDDAMSHIKDGILALHRAGRHVLGVDQYDDFMEQRLEKVIEREETR